MFTIRLRGMKRLQQTAFGQDVTFTIETFQEETVDSTVLSYMIDAYEASASSFAKSYDFSVWLEDIAEDGFGHNADTYTLYLSLDVEKYIPSDNRMIIEIPKRNHNLQEFDNDLYQKD